MKLLNYLMILIIILLIALMFSIHGDIQTIKKTINIEIESEETDLSTDCMIFPCYTAPHKIWVNQKYLTKGAL